MTKRLPHAMSLGLAIAALAASPSSMAQPSAPSPATANAPGATGGIRADDAWCRRSKWCTVKGRCVLQGNRCVASRDLDCQRSEQCRDLGRCSASSGVCLADSDPWCRQSQACKTDGRCTADGGRCIDAPKVREDPRPTPRASTGPWRPSMSASYGRARHDKASAPRRSSGNMAVGVVVVALGGIGILAGGAVGMASDLDNVSFDVDGGGSSQGGTNEGEEAAMAVLMISGGTLLLTGIPLIAYGAGSPSDNEPGQGSLGALEPSWQPELQVGPTGGSATWRF